MIEIDYTHGYYQELNPLRARLALLFAGLHCPIMDTACELGFGQGMSINLHAAASPVAWHGTDANPAHVAFAREIARAAGSEARLAAEPFAEYAARRDMPEFDSSACMGCGVGSRRRTRPSWLISSAASSNREAWST